MLLQPPYTHPAALELEPGEEQKHNGSIEDEEGEQEGVT
jgi:hypothetical protein